MRFFINCHSAVLYGLCTVYIQYLLKSQVESVKSIGPGWSKAKSSYIVDSWKSVQYTLHLEITCGIWYHNFWTESPGNKSHKYTGNYNWNRGGGFNLFEKILISQNRNLPQIEWKSKIFETTNHHLVKQRSLFSFRGLRPICPDVDFPRLQLRGSAIEESHDLDAWCLFEMAKKIWKVCSKRS